MQRTIQWWAIPMSFWLLSFSGGRSEDPTPVTDPDSGNTTSFEWTIPQNQIFDGGVGRDGIPSINLDSQERKTLLMFRIGNLWWS